VSDPAAAAPVPPPAAGVVVRPPEPHRLLERFLEHQQASTRAAYGRDLADFARWLGASDARRAAECLCALPTPGPANQLVHDYVSHLRQRALAILRLLSDLGLRRTEVAELDYPAHLDEAAGTVDIREKGDHDRVPLTLPDETLTAIQAWLEVRSRGPGPFFVSPDGAAASRAGEPQRLSATSIYRELREKSVSGHHRLVPGLQLTLKWSKCRQIDISQSFP